MLSAAIGPALAGSTAALLAPEAPLAPLAGERPARRFGGRAAAFRGPRALAAKIDPLPVEAAPGSAAPGSAAPVEAAPVEAAPVEATVEKEEEMAVFTPTDDGKVRVAGLDVTMLVAAPPSPAEARAAKKVEAKAETCGQFIRRQLIAGLGTEAILEAVRVAFPASKATKADVAWNRGRLRKAGELAACGRAPCAPKAVGGLGKRAEADARELVAAAVSSYRAGALGQRRHAAVVAAGGRVTVAGYLALGFSRIDLKDDMRKGDIALVVPTAA